MSCGANSYVSLDRLRLPLHPFIYLFPSLFSLPFDTHTPINQLKHTLKPTNPPPQTINMSAPNANAPNEGIVGQVTNSISVCLPLCYPYNDFL